MQFHNVQLPVFYRWGIEVFQILGDIISLIADISPNWGLGIYNSGLIDIYNKISRIWISSPIWDIQSQIVDILPNFEVRTTYPEKESPNPNWVKDSRLISINVQFKINHWGYHVYWVIKFIPNTKLDILFQLWHMKSSFGKRYTRIGIIGHLLGPNLGDFANNYVMMERLDSAKSPNLGLKRCPIKPALVNIFL